MLEQLQLLQQQGGINAVDWHFARFIEQQAESSSAALTLAACLASHSTSSGNVCVNLYGYAGQVVLDSNILAQPIVAPPAKTWLQQLHRSRVVGRPGEFKPLILDHRGRLYLYRYWDYEQRLQENLLQRVAGNIADIEPTLLRNGLNRLFAPTAVTPDWQKIAAATAIAQHFCVISGGPGTGKTTTVLRLLALLIEQYQHHGQLLNIALAAPTGKAAARLQEAIRAGKQQLDLPAIIAAAIPEQASTLHRLLGSRANSIYFHHDKDNPLSIDVLIVDEASMVDLALMTKLAEALPNKSRLILLGDKDQLASVEAGAVLGDICGPATGFTSEFAQQLQDLTAQRVPAAQTPTKSLSNNIVLLRHSYRFGSDSGIGQLATAVNRGQAETAQQLFADQQFADILWQQPESQSHFTELLNNTVKTDFAAYLQALRQPQQLAQLFAAFNHFRVLCALRNGPFGVEQINQQIERALHTQGLLRVRLPWYPGRPVMITRNDYNLRLYNGDIGITLPDPEQSGQLRVYFTSSDNNGVRSLAPNRLPEHETVYAMTIHKSQGSEFNKVLLLLPAEQSRLLTRELLYTGITRARQEAEIWGASEIFGVAIQRQLQRSSGLRDTLWA